MASGKGLFDFFLTFVGFFFPLLENFTFPLLRPLPGNEGSEQTRVSEAGPVTARWPQVGANGAQPHTGSASLGDANRPQEPRAGLLFASVGATVNIDGVLCGCFLSVEASPGLGRSSIEVLFGVRRLLPILASLPTRDFGIVVRKTSLSQKPGPFLLVCLFVCFEKPLCSARAPDQNPVFSLPPFVPRSCTSAALSLWPAPCGHQSPCGSPPAGHGARPGQ